MTEKDARNLIEEDLKQKMLGPGYATDLIQCSSDATDEIIPENPRRAYSLGVLLPPPRNNGGNVADNVDEDDISDDTEETIDDVNDNNNGDEIEDPIEDDEGEIEKKISGKVEDKEADAFNSTTMTSHIGMVACVSDDTSDVKIDISYGIYTRLSWQESKEKVKVLTGRFDKSIGKAIDLFAQEEKIRKATEEAGLKSFSEWFSINNDDKTISLSEQAPEPEYPHHKKGRPLPNYNHRIWIPDGKGAYFVESSMIDVLIKKPHYQRKHNSYSLTLPLTNNGIQPLKDGQSISLGDGVCVYWDTFKANNKKFVKVLLQTNSRIIYQPQIVLTSPKGKIVSYTEPITLIDDEENNINEFIYRNVSNFGKGVNCAIGWEISDNGECQKVFTTFTPTVDVEKFSNDVSGKLDDKIKSACTLRNLSIWSELSNEELLQNLDAFVSGYAQWQNKQQSIADAETQHWKEAQKIAEKQKEILRRLKDNVNYLRNNEEALTCFKIANTAMLLQMVVARHPDFKKNRDVVPYDNELDIFNRLDYFSNAKYLSGMRDRKEPQYYPFQLAFLLMNVKSTFDMNDNYHKDVVDLIWFPTGGGKTEAYLALTALTIVHRRRRGQNKGVSVIMRYTLRMLTSQQFERASYLICALEFLRVHTNLGLGNKEISIGIYVGGGVTPNNSDDLRNNNNKYGRYLGNNNPDPNKNPFPVVYCPWCGAKLVNNPVHGYQNNGDLLCLNNRCCYSGNRNLPLYYIDDNIYLKKPTLLFATVDKLAQLAQNREAARLLNPGAGIDSPDLIIQDELHLLVGALGSIVGLYESIVEALIKKNGRVPKIIASTATTRNTKSLIKKLYNRDVTVFPPQGLKYDDNYFSHVEEVAKRRHVGMMPSQNITSNFAEIRLSAFRLLSRVKVFKKFIEDSGGDWFNADDVRKFCLNNNTLNSLLDNYWTNVLYFNSLKDLGQSRSRVFQEVRENCEAHEYLYQIPKSLSVLRNMLYHGVIEFTSRVDSSQIKGFLTKAEANVRMELVDNDKQDTELCVTSGSDLIYASNMISVGIDISRWNSMIMVGQPRSTSEYIQSSSRVARNTFGLVINLFNPRRVREFSLFENYIPFHKTFYKSVEPLSITPLTESTIKHNVLNNMIKIYKDYIENDNGAEGEDLATDMIRDIFNNRFEMDDTLRSSLSSRIAQWEEQGEMSKSLRDIESNAFISIKQIEYNR